MVPLRFLRSLVITCLCLIFWQGQSFAQVSFTANVTSGCNPLIVNFTANAPGAVSYSWDLGNSTFSAQQNPSVTYTSGGLFNVTLTVSYANGSTASFFQPGYIEVFNPPQPAFAGAPLALCSGNDVTFTNSSQPGSGAITGWLWDFGDGTTSTQQAPVHTYNLAGNFQVKLVATDVNGCSALVEKNAYVQVNNTASADFTASNTLSCNTPFPVNFVTINPVLGTTHTWNLGNGATPITANPSTTYNATGNYTVTHIVTDPIGCADTVTKTNYIQVGSPQINFQVSNNQICQGQAVTFTCGAAPGSLVNWNFGNGNTSNSCQVTVPYNTPGTYVASISITDPSGCSYNASQPITVHPRPTVDFSLSDTLLCEAPHEVTLNYTGTGGTDFSWSFGDGNLGTGASVTHIYPTLPINSSTGQPYLWDISLTVKNQFGCEASLTKTQALSTGQTVAIAGADSRIGCVPRQVDFFDFSKTNSIVTSWQWDFGVPGGTSTLKNPNFTYTNTGAYDVTLIIETLHGCRDTFFSPGFIEAGDTPVANFIADTTQSCASEAIQFYDQSIGNDSTRWIFGDGGATSAPDPLHQFKDTGYLSVMLIALDRGCPDTMFVDSMVFIDPPIANFQPFSKFGCDTPFTVNFTDFSIGAETWLWDFGDGSPTTTTPSPVHTYMSEGTFNPKLVVENLTTGCIDSLFGVIKVEAVEASFAIDTTFGCIPVDVQFDDLSYKAVTWNWSFGDGYFSTADEPGHTYTLPGEYDVSLFVVNSLGCTDDTTIVKQVSVYEPQISFTAVPDQGCAPLTVSFTNNTTSLAPVVNWQWTFGPTGAASTQQAPTFTYNNPGSWDVKLIATDSIGCIAELDKTDEVFVSRPVANFSTPHPVNCVNNPITFANTSTGSGLNYLWDFGDGNTSGAFSPTHTYTQNGSYTVTLTVTDFQGCDSTLVLPNYITIADPQVSLTPDTTNADCPPLLVNFTGNTLSPHTFSQWLWDFGDNGTSAGQNPSHIYSQPGTYTVEVTATAASGCSTSFTATNLITINGPTGSFTVAPTAACPHTPLTFTATSPNATVFTWDFNNGVLGSGQTTTYGYPNSGTYAPLLILEDSSGCVIVIPNNTPVVIHPVPQASFTETNPLLCDSGSVVFTNTSSSTVPISSTSWNFGLGLGTSAQGNPSFFFGNTGSYGVQLIVENLLGCRDTALKQGLVVVSESPDARIGVPDTVGCAPFAVSFTDLSTAGSGLITARQWFSNVAAPQFGTQPQASFTYQNPGFFTPILRVTDQNGCVDADTISLEALAPPVANFAADDSFGCAPKPIQFTSLTPNAVDWEWNFGDGSPKVFIDDPLHTYFADGTYTVTMAVTDVQGCKDTLIKPQYINLDHPVADFTVSDTVICPNEPLQFTDLSVSDTTLSGWAWRFGNGDLSAQQNPNYAYPASGLYAVTLTVRDVFGCEDSTTKDRLVRIREDETPASPGIHVVTVESGTSIRVVFARYDNFRRDFGSYSLLRDDGSGIWTPVFFSANINDTVYTDTGLATDTRSYCYRLEVSNHCNRASEFRESDVHCSILMQTESLVDAIEVHWNPYQGWPVQAYEVYRVNNYDKNNIQLVATVGGNDTSWVDEDMFCYDAHIYRVKAIEVDAPWESWSNIRREAPQHFGPPFPMDIHVATVEQDSFVLVKWGEVPPGDNLVNVLIERDAGNGYQSWHTQSVNDPQREKADYDVNVHVRPYSYQAYVIDTCGDVTPAGQIGRTILLEAEKLEGTVSLTWSPYEQWDRGVEQYQIELYDETRGEWVMVTTVNGGVLEYLDRQTELAQGEYCYRIVAIESGGNRQISVSNESCILVDPLLYFPNAFSPNADGYNDAFVIKGAYIDQFSMEIYNRWGEKIFVTTNQAAGWNGQTESGMAQEGVYVFKVVGIGYEGEQIRRSGTVTLFR